MQDVMLDLETLGVRPGCTVLSIGAVMFGREGLGAEFHAVISRNECRMYGLVEEERTVRWWADQSTEARKTLDAASSTSTSLAKPLLDVLHGFRTFLHRYGGEDVRVWGNGADFDQPILAASWYAAHAKSNDLLPWKPFNGRCYRTLKNLQRDVKLERIGVYHNALDDAKSQAEHAVRLFQALSLVPS